MRSGPGPSLIQRLFPWLATLLIIGILVVGTLWARREQDALSGAEARAATLQDQLTQAQASITAIAQAQADATATAESETNNPSLALQHALQLVFAAYQDPSDAHIQALSDAFSPAGLGFENTEAQHLQTAQTHLGGQSAYTVNVLDSSATGDTATVSTQEHWEYDEVDASNTRVRCLVEDSQQTYGMDRVQSGWLVDTVTLENLLRTDC